MEKINLEIAVIKTEMKNITKQIDEGFSNNAIQHKELMASLQKALDQKAGKWVEKVVVGVGMIVGTAFLGALISLIII